MEYRWNDQDADVERDELALLVYLSNLVGADAGLTQPGGGNSSVKRVEADFAGRSVDVLRVKGSGTDLRTIGAGGFTGMRREDLALLRAREQMSDEQMMAFMRACMLDSREPAPSVETPLHSVLPYRFIVHTHDFATQALTDTPDPAALVRQALGSEVAYIDYVQPGYPLARAVMDLGPLPGEARGLVLGRHGLIAWGDTAKGCYQNLHALINRAEAFIDGRQGRAGRTAAESTTTTTTATTATIARRRDQARVVLPILRAGLGARRPVILHWDGSDEAVAFAGAPGTPALAARGMSTPEHILRCGRVPLVVGVDLEKASAAEAISVLTQALDRFAASSADVHARHRAQVGATMLDPAPRVILLPGLGLVTAMKDKTNAVVGNLCYRHVMRVMSAAEALGGFRFLNEADAITFEYWPLELAKLNAPEKELSRRVALVTGAAGGIGRAIAQRFAAEGAHLVLTDVAGERLRQVAQAIAQQCKDSQRVIAVEGDATSPEDAAAAVTDAVLAFGGLDILVCNAGFIEAGPIDRISDESWARHFGINVGGTFLAVREAVKVMKVEGQGTILLNASKGAFAPTADNAAYASSKAAVAALARNLATELGPHSIRVNYINADFIDTPLMEKLIAARAALAGVSIEEQTDAYRRRNLLNVGPIPPAAVAEAALFLVSPRAQYTTGAVLTVDGGIKEAMPR
ncbi:MAG TPA: SDR family oxidoreductase [Polyangia bacterium]|nr:SDR family oxidoreductase [Polyangia bacterium]